MTNRLLERKRTGLAKILPYLMFAMICLQPVLDILTYWQAELGVTLSFYPRIAVFLIMVIGGFVLSEHKVAHLVLYGVLGLFWAAHLFVCYRVGLVDAVDDTKNFISVIQLPVTVFCTVSCLRITGDRGMDWLDFGMVGTLTILLISFIVAWATGTEPHTYPDRGVGIAGYSFWVNSQSAILSLSTPIAIGWSIRKFNKRNLPHTLINIAVIVISMLMLYMHGTRLSYLCMLLAGFGMAIVVLIARAPKRYAIVLLAVTVLTIAFVNLSPMFKNRSFTADVTNRKATVTERLQLLADQQIENGTNTALKAEGAVPIYKGMRAFAAANAPETCTFTDVQPDALFKLHLSTEEKNIIKRISDKAQAGLTERLEDGRFNEEQAVYAAYVADLCGQNAVSYWKLAVKKYSGKEIVEEDLLSYRALVEEYLQSAFRIPEAAEEAEQALRTGEALMNAADEQEAVAIITDCPLSRMDSYQKAIVFQEQLAYVQLLEFVNASDKIYDIGPASTVKNVSIICSVVRANEEYNGITGVHDWQLEGGTWFSYPVAKAEEYGIYTKEEYDAAGWSLATRASAAHLLYRMLPAAEYPALRDVEMPEDVAETPYADEILTLYRAGVFLDYEDGTLFNPDKAITRTEYMVWLAAAVNPDFRLCDAGFEDAKLAVTPEPIPVTDTSGLDPQTLRDAQLYPLYNLYLVGMVNRFGIRTVLEQYGYTTDTATIISEREWKLQYNRILMKQSGTMSKLFGLENTRLLFRGYSYDVENDVHAIYFRFGIVGLILMLLFLGFFVFCIIRALIKRFRQVFTVQAGAIGLGLIALALHTYYTCGVLRRANALVYFGTLLAMAYYLTDIKQYPPYEKPDKKKKHSEKKEVTPEPAEG